MKFTYWSQCIATTPKARSPDDSERRVPTSMYDRIALMLTCCRHGRTKYIGSRCSTGLIAVHQQQCARHGRPDSTRTSGGPIDRRRACEEETAKGRFHLQVSTLSQHPITLRCLPCSGCDVSLTWQPVHYTVYCILYTHRRDDMMSILFPHLCEDVEFMLPPNSEEDVDVEMRDHSTVMVPAGADASSYATSPSRSSRRVHENAVAGPSRLG